MPTHFTPLTVSLSTGLQQPHRQQLEYSKPSHAPQGIFTPDAHPAATLPISGLEIHWLAYSEPRLGYRTESNYSIQYKNSN